MYFCNNNFAYDLQGFAFILGYLTSILVNNQRDLYKNYYFGFFIINTIYLIIRSIS